MIGPELLKQEIIKHVHARSVTKAMVVGFMAKSANKLAHPPDWMSVPAFCALELDKGGDQSWLELNVSERKYHVRKALSAMLDTGHLRKEPYTTRFGSKQLRLRLGSVLDRFAAIDEAEQS